MTLGIKPRRPALVCVLMLLLSLPAGAQTTTPETAAPAATPAPAAATPASRAKHATPTRPHRAIRAAKPPATAASKSTAKPKEGVDGMPRTLEDVHIEGEIPVPQVLFITARDQRRFMDFQHHRFMRSSKQLGEETPYPTWIAVIHDQPIDQKKETSR